MEARRHGVLLGNRRIGVLAHRGDVVRFTLDDDYWSDPDRPVLGLWFEDHPRESPQAALRLPTWFSNLLPEGVLRDWIARDRGVSAQREMELLLQVGSDLPGGVVVVEDGAELDTPLDDYLDAVDSPTIKVRDGWKFSLAGIGMKFSLLQRDDRLTVPASNELGDWIVKLPHANYRNVPRNEYEIMTLAKSCGLDAPDVKLVDRAVLPDLPDVAWPSDEHIAYAVKRFDRTESGGRIHIEDLAQVRGFYPESKYEGSFETIAALVFRGVDHRSLEEFVRRIVFNILIGNGDAHLKNWSLMYPDGRTPTLSPAYDLVSTAGYFPNPSTEDLGLKFGGSRRFSVPKKSTIVRLALTLGASEERLIHVAEETTANVREHWSAIARDDMPKSVVDWVDKSLERPTFN